MKQTLSVLSFYIRFDKPVTRVTNMGHGKFSVARGIHSCPILFYFILFLLPNQRLYIVKNVYVCMCVCVCVYIYIYIYIYILYICTYQTAHRS